MRIVRELLDNTIVLFGSGASTNVHRSILRSMGIGLESFAGSNGTVSGSIFGKV